MEVRKMGTEIWVVALLLSQALFLPIVQAAEPHTERISG
jgi:hypothetical protein